MHRGLGGQNRLKIIGLLRSIAVHGRCGEMIVLRQTFSHVPYPFCGDKTEKPNFEKKSTAQSAGEKEGKRGKEE